MTKTSRIYGELMADHQRIRAAMTDIRELAVRARAGEGSGGELEPAVVDLAEMVLAHNLREEELLGTILPSLDAHDPARSAAMLDEHAREHERLHTALVALPRTPPAMAGVGVIALIALIRQHMDREESSFLRRDLLCGDAT